MPHEASPLHCRGHVRRLPRECRSGRRVVAAGAINDRPSRIVAIIACRRVRGSCGLEVWLRGKSIERAPFHSAKPCGSHVVARSAALHLWRGHAGLSRSGSVQRQRCILSAVGSGHFGRCARFAWRRGSGKTVCAGRLSRQATSSCRQRLERRHMRHNKAVNTDAQVRPHTRFASCAPFLVRRLLLR
jgi:hypothetical protein